MQSIISSVAATLPDPSRLSSPASLGELSGPSGLSGLSGGVDSLAGPGGVQAPTAAPFSDLLTDAVGQVNQLETQASAAVTGLLSGSGVDVHQALIATTKASMAFELALAVRNKAVQAYQSVVAMQF